MFHAICGIILVAIFLIGDLDNMRLGRPTMLWYPFSRKQGTLAAKYTHNAIPTLPRAQGDPAQFSIAEHETGRVTYLVLESTNGKPWRPAARRDGYDTIEQAQAEIDRMTKADVDRVEAFPYYAKDDVAYRVYIREILPLRQPDAAYAASR